VALVTHLGAFRGLRLLWTSRAPGGDLVARNAPHAAAFRSASLGGDERFLAGFATALSPVLVIELASCRSPTDSRRRRTTRIRRATLASRSVCPAASSKQSFGPKAGDDVFAVSGGKCSWRGVALGAVSPWAPPLLSQFSSFQDWSRILVDAEHVDGVRWYVSL